MSQSIKGYGGLVLHMHATQLSGLLMHSWQQCVYKKKHIIKKREKENGVEVVTVFS